VDVSCGFDIVSDYNISINIEAKRISN